MKPEVRFELDGTIFVWNLERNYVEIYNSLESPKHLIATVPAGPMIDMCSYIEGEELYNPDLNFNPDDELEGFWID